MNLLEDLLNQLRGLRNAVDFRIRQTVRWSRPGFHLTNENKQQLFRSIPSASRLDLQRQAEALRLKYQLDRLYHLSTIDNYRENLYYLRLVETAFERLDIALPDTLNVVDIGPSSWFYIRGIYQLLRLWKTSAPRQVNITGFETDAYRVYSNFHSRYDHAQAYSDGLSGVSYQVSAFTPKSETWDLIFLFFPFIYLQDHLAWGLPRSTHQPEKLLMDAWGSLKPGGAILIANQGESEALQQKAMLSKAGINSQMFLFDSQLYQYDIPRYVHTAIKPG